MEFFDTNEFASGSFSVIPQTVLKPYLLIVVNAEVPGLSSYPNPFKGTTNLSYTLPVAATVSLKVYNVLGMVVKNPVDAHQAAAAYTVNRRVPC